MHRFLQAAIGTLLMGGVFVLPSGSANAATECDATVIDRTSDQVLDTKKIEAATEALEDRGADVRVRAFQTAPGGSLDGYVEDQLANCASWRAPGQTKFPKGNLIVLAFSMEDRQSKIYYGANFKAKLNPVIDEIRADEMNAQFRLGNFTDGIVNSEQAIYDTLTAKPTTTTSSPGMPETDKAGGMVLTIIAYILLAVAIVGCMFGLVKLVQYRRRLHEERVAARKAALAADTKASELVGSLSLDSVENLYKIVITDLDDRDQRRLDDQRGKATEKYHAIIMSEPYPAGLDPNSTKLRTSDYEEVIQYCNDRVGQATAAANAIFELEEECNCLLEEIKAAPETLSTLESRLATLREQEASLKSKGYRIDESYTFRSLRQLLDEAQREVEDKHYGQALDELYRSAEDLDALEARLTFLQEVRDKLTVRMNTLREVQHAATTDVNAGSTAFATIKQQYHESCWQDLVEQELAAHTHLSKADKWISEATRAASMDQQNWDEAKFDLDQAAAALDTADRFLVVVDERSRSLAQLETEVSVELDRLRQKVGEAQSQIGGYKGKQGKRLAALQQVEEQVVGLRQSLQDDRPQYLAINEAIDRYTESVADILRKARKVHDDIVEERERRRREERAVQQRRNSSFDSSGSNFATGFAVGSSFGSSSSGGFDFGGGGSSGGWGGDSGGGSSGGW